MRHKKAPPYNKQFLLFKLSTTRGAYHYGWGFLFIILLQKFDKYY